MSRFQLNQAREDLAAAQAELATLRKASADRMAADQQTIDALRKELDEARARLVAAERDDDTDPPRPRRRRAE